MYSCVTQFTGLSSHIIFTRGVAKTLSYTARLRRTCVSVRGKRQWRHSTSQAPMWSAVSQVLRHNFKYHSITHAPPQLVLVVPQPSQPSARSRRENVHCSIERSSKELPCFILIGDVVVQMRAAAFDVYCFNVENRFGVTCHLACHLPAPSGPENC